MQLVVSATCRVLQTDRSSALGAVILQTQLPAAKAAHRHNGSPAALDAARPSRLALACCLAMATDDDEAGQDFADGFSMSQLGTSVPGEQAQEAEDEALWQPTGSGAGMGDIAALAAATLMCDLCDGAGAPLLAEAVGDAAAEMKAESWLPEFAEMDQCCDRECLKVMYFGGTPAMTPAGSDGVTLPQPAAGDAGAGKVDGEEPEDRPETDAASPAGSEALDGQARAEERKMRAAGTYTEAQIMQVPAGARIPLRESSMLIACNAPIHRA